MRLLFVADGRSPIALNWIKHWTDAGHEVHLVSTFTCQPDLPLAGLEVVSVAYSSAKPRPDPSTGSEQRPVEGSAAAAGRARGSFLWGARTLQLRVSIRRWMGPLTVSRSSRRLTGIIQRVRPDLVHAMRIPYEGMLAADAIAAMPDAPPLLVSVWGNDFTLHAPSSPPMRHYTEWTMQVADALHADCQRDIRLAKEWGFKPGLPTLVSPGNGGIRREIFHPAAEPPAAPVVLNPRGFRGYVRNDTFFKSIPIVLRERPEARFVCAAMAGEPQAQAWIKQLGVEGSVELLPPCSQAAMADVYRAAQVLVSPSTHDGTPNSLLEGMACGCFPVTGDIDSLREWITPGVNGLLVDPADPQGLAEATLRALDDPALRQGAASRNAEIIATRAEYGANMQRAEEFYYKVGGKK
jgi:glycosyltransferase involved in cell wall biosynthesis